MTRETQDSDPRILYSTSNTKQNLKSHGRPIIYGPQDPILWSGPTTKIPAPAPDSSFISKECNSSSSQPSQQHTKIPGMNHLWAGNWNGYNTSSAGVSSKPIILMNSKPPGYMAGIVPNQANLEDRIHHSRDFLACSPHTGVESSSGTTGHFQLDANHNYVTDPKKAYLELIPLINKVTRNNYWEFLITFLKKCLHQVPLDEFYKLLFNADKNKGSEPLLKIHKSGSTPFEKEGLQLCHFIIQTFSCTWNDIKPFASGYVTNSLLSTIEPQDFRRVFLAAKIMFDTISQSENPTEFSSCVSRSDVHQLYLFISEKLLKTYLVNGNTPLTKDLVIGQSHLGKIVRLKHPNLTSIRLGRRGSSKYHYVGISWNRTFMDEEIVNLLHLKEGEKLRSLKFTKIVYLKALPMPMNKPQEEGNSPVKKPPNLSKYTNYSFVQKLSKYPRDDCSPRSWLVVAGKVPERSKWVDFILLKAVGALKRRGIDVSNLIENFTVDMFSQRFLLTFTEEFIRCLAILRKTASKEEVYLQLYLVVLLLVFPVILSDDEEVSRDNRSQLRTNLEEFAARVNIELRMLKVEYPHFLIIVTNIIQKMIHINDLALVHVRSTSVEDIVRGFVGHLERPSEGQLNLPNCLPAKAGLYLQEVHKARSSFANVLPNGINGETNETNTRITDSFKIFCLSTAKAVLKIRELITEDDLRKPYYELPMQLLKALLPVLHRSCLTDPWITQLPIQGVNFILLQINKELQNISLRDFGKDDLELFKEFSESWRVYSSAMEEYLIVFSEISALVGHLFAMTEESKL